MKTTELENKLDELTLNPFALARQAKQGIRNYLDDKKLAKDKASAVKGYATTFANWRSKNGVKIINSDSLKMWMRSGVQNYGLGVNPAQTLELIRSEPNLRLYLDSNVGGAKIFRDPDLMKFFQLLASAAFKDTEDQALDIILGQIETLLNKAKLPESISVDNRWVIAEKLTPAESNMLKKLGDELKQWKNVGLVNSRDDQEKVDNAITQIDSYFGADTADADGDGKPDATEPTKPEAPASTGKPNAEEFAKKLEAMFNEFSDADGSIGSPAVRQVIKNMWMRSGGTKAESKKINKDLV